ncbi:Glucan 1 [Diplonema papillatum]|nr:Glucan 1 [Diplonema papillatum]
MVSRFSLVLALLATAVAGQQNCTSWYDTTQRGKWFRNAKDFGAKGDGVTDDTSALQTALTQGRQDQPSTKEQLVVYLPPGTYLVSDTLRVYFYTLLTGNDVCPATIKMAPNVSPTGTQKFIVAGPVSCNGCQHTDDFYYQVNNLVLDYTNPGNGGGCAMHWAVSQGTSLRNIVFNLGDAAVGLFGENGSGGFMGDLVFNGGNIGIYFGNQQWTFRNLQFHNQKVIAIQMIWNWFFTFVHLNITNTPVGIQFMDAGAAITIVDSSFSNVGTAIWTDYPYPTERKSIVLQRVQMTNVVNMTSCYETAPCTAPAVPAPAMVEFWKEGLDANNLNGPVRGNVQSPFPLTPVPRVTYPTYEADSVYNVMSSGAKGDGVTDDTAAIQSAIAAHDYVFFPYGVYLVTKTLTLGGNTHLIGESMTELTAGAGSDDYTVMIMVPDNATATTTITKFLLTVQQESPQLTMVQWGAGKGQIYDTHYRLYFGVAEMFHATAMGGGYIENMWGWVADHDIDSGAGITVKNPKGFRAESTNPLVLMGVAFEHSADHQFSFEGARDVTVITAQTETAYWQTPPTGFGMQVVGTTGFTLIGGGFYNWFNGVQNVLFSVASSTNVALILPNVNQPNADRSQGSMTILKTTASSYPVGPPFNNTFCSHFSVLVNTSIA